MNFLKRNIIAILVGLMLLAAPVYAAFQGNILAESGGGTVSLGLGGQGVISGGGAFTIDTQNAWHMVDTIAPNGGHGMTVTAGTTGAITVFADGGGGTSVDVTSAGHSLVTGDIISITGTTNYNDVFEVNSTSGDDFNVTDTWNGDDATGTFRRGTSGIITADQVGWFIYLWSVSATAAQANSTFDFAVFLDTTPKTPIKRKFSTNTDVGAMAGHSLLENTAGITLSFGVRNTSNAANITINEGAWTMFKSG